MLATYKKYHDQGFKILGISRDKDKDRLIEVTKHKGMTWPQFFDGSGWENKIARQYGIDGIPEMWLLDKKGMLRVAGVRGEALGGKVAELLKE